jgi:4-hydroxy-tetrahydrodipicolinate synthase
MPNFSGIFPILATPFRDDGSTDFDSLTRLIRHLLSQGAHGLGLFGNASEGYTLSSEERIQLMRLIRKEAPGVPLIASSGHTGTDEAVRLSRELEDLGADGLMVLPPYFLKTDGDGLMHYFDSISRAVRIPIMVQDAPLLTQVAMPPALLARMGREIENVRMVKVEAPPTAPKVTAVAAAAGDALILFGGLNAQFMIEEIDRGARGMMPGSDLTAELVRVWSQLEGGDRMGAWRTFTRILPLLRFQLQPGMGVSAMKHNLVSEGVIASARVRHPTASLGAESLRELSFLRNFVKASEDEPAAVRA